MTDADAIFPQPDVVYIFLRKGLEKYNPLYPAIQLGHAAYELARRQTWINPFTKHGRTHTFVVLEARDELHLYDIACELEKLGHQYHWFWEPDHNTGWTAIAVEAVSGADREWFRQFKLYPKPTFWTKLKALFRP